MRKLLAFAVPILTMLVTVDTVRSTEVPPAKAVRTSKAQTPFDTHVRVHEHIYVYERSQFSPHTGPAEFSCGDHCTTERLGSVTFSPGLSVFVDRSHVPVNVWLSLINTKTGKLLGDINIREYPSGARLLFNGQGTVYLYNQAPDVCRGMVTRKFVLQNERLVETQQPVIYLDSIQEDTTNGDVTLFPSLQSRTPSLRLTDGTRVLVLGISSEKNPENSSTQTFRRPILVKSPLGLTGWFIPERSQGNLSTSIACG